VRAAHGTWGGLGRCGAGASLLQASFWAGTESSGSYYTEVVPQCTGSVWRVGIFLSNQQKLSLLDFALWSALRACDFGECFSCCALCVQDGPAAYGITCRRRHRAARRGTQRQHNQVILLLDGCSIAAACFGPGLGSAQPQLHAGTLLREHVRSEGGLGN
jgi:hypothetical protein